MPKACEVQMKPVISLNHLFVGARFNTMKAFIVCHPINIQEPTTTTEATTTTTRSPVTTVNFDSTTTSTKASTFIASTTSNPQDQESKCKVRMIPKLLPMTINSILAIPESIKNCIPIPYSTPEPPSIGTTTKVPPRKCRKDFIPSLNPHPSSLTGQYFKKPVVVCEPTNDPDYD